MFFASVFMPLSLARFLVLLSVFGSARPTCGLRGCHPLRTAMDAFCSPRAAAKPPSQDAKMEVAATPALKPQNAAVTATPAVKPPAPPTTTSEKAAETTSKTQKKKVAQGTWSSSVRRQLEKADARAAAALQSNEITTEAVERVLAGISEWPTQARPNVSPDAKAVTGMCLGAVNVRGRAQIKSSRHRLTV